MPKPEACKNCGCSRKIILQGTMREQNSAGFYGAAKFNWLCIDCLLRKLKAVDFAGKKVNTKVTLKTVD